MIDVYADEKLRDPISDAVLVHVADIQVVGEDEHVEAGAMVVLHDTRGSGKYPAKIEWLDERAGHAGLRIIDEPSRMERFRAENAFQELVNAAMGEARRNYDTGDRAQSMICLQEHLKNVPRLEIITADVYRCPVCGHTVKDRRRRS